MRKLVILLSLVAGAFAITYAQNTSVHAYVSAGTTQNNVYAAIGQPFFQQLSSPDGSLEFSFGVAQAQLTKDTVYDVVTYNEPYTANNLNLPQQTQSNVSTNYIVNGGQYHYDLLRTLYLIVCPENVLDAVDNNIAYRSVGVSGHCWTKQNLRSPVANVLTYNSLGHPAGSINIEKYGLLYTWQVALNGTSTDADGYVKGICPPNWHLPTVEETNSLFENPIVALRSTEGWINTAENTNSTGFSAYPAGFYNSDRSRFEGLGTQTDWWMANGTTANGTVTASPTETLHATSVQLPYFCDTPQYSFRNPNDAVSVRCVMKNVWPE